MRKLPVDEFHRRLGKDFLTIADYAVPACYSSVDQECKTAFDRPVLFDRSFWGLIQISGKDAGSLLQRLTTNDLKNVNPGGGLVNIFTNAKGRIVDVVEMMRRDDDFLLITSPGRGPALLQWIDKYTFIEDVRGSELNSTFALFSIFGRVVRNFAGLPIDDLHPHEFCEARLAEMDVVLHRGDGITPEGLNILVHPENAMPVWDFLCGHAEPIGFSTYDALRIHAGIPASDAEINEQQNPYEVNLRPFINYEKGCYIGQEVIARLDTYEKVQRQLVGLEFERNAVPAEKSVLVADGKEIGVITSVAHSPIRNTAIGLGLLRKDFAEENRPLTAQAAEHSWLCKVVSLPFTRIANT